MKSNERPSYFKSDPDEYAIHSAPIEIVHLMILAFAKILRKIDNPIHSQTAPIHRVFREVSPTRLLPLYLAIDIPKK